MLKITTSQMPSAFITELHTLIDQKLPKNEADLLKKFAEVYYSNICLEDLEDHLLQDLFGALISHWRLINQRKPHQSLVRVFNPVFELDGWQSKYTIVEVATDDMPFLVDSLRMEINRKGYKVHFMIHLGEMKLKRDKEFKVIDVLPFETSKNNAMLEAPIYIEIEHESDKQILKNLQTGLENILNDVRVSVEDWPKMRERMRVVIEELNELPRTIDQEDIQESKAFLNWLDDDHFTYIGYRDYELKGEGEDLALCIVSGTGLGVLRHEDKSKARRFVSSMPPAAKELAFAKHILVISKTNTKSTVHRPVYTDYIGIKRYNEKGELIGEHRFIGLYTSTAYNTHPKDIPLLSHKVDVVVKRSKLPLRSHSGKELIDILTTLPRDDLFQANIDELNKLALGILRIQDRQRIHLFVRQDAYRRFVSCLVYLPREQFNPHLDKAIQEILTQAFSGLEISSFPLFSESPLARVHYLIRTDYHKDLTFDVKEIEAKLIDAGRGWIDELHDSLIVYYGDKQGSKLIAKYEHAFPASYREEFTPRAAIYDINHIEKLSPTNTLEMNFYRLPEPSNKIHFKLYHFKDPVILSDVLPMLENMGLRVIEERPHEIKLKNQECVWIHDFEVEHSVHSHLDIISIKDNFQEAFAKVWFGDAENDGFNRLVLAAGLSWREAVLLRAYAKYLRQIGFTFSQSYIETTLEKNKILVRQLIDLFQLLFNPNRETSFSTSLPELQQQIKVELTNVLNLDEDRILRRYWEVLQATLRTNYFQKDAEGNSKPMLSLKLDSTRIPELPLPKPAFEIFVYSPRLEAIHLRTAKVARGGLRWSDRREDFRTEVLGLMKAQQVKNALIVPAGAKGGFVTKNLPVDGTREEVMEEVVNCYQSFIRGMLDITDNIVNGDIVHPADTIIYDSDDPYLVVAADKGTATFSDLANSISEEYQFWLGDAFASGGSAGYDHKKIGITARGAWESVKRHLSVLGINPEENDFTVVGIGDMNGDVFGNGMLLSKHIKLVGAFNHMHIFLDPTPDSLTSFKERERLFNLPRSTWEDYNPNLISLGGGVFKRSAKTIPLSQEVKSLLKLDQDEIEPNALIRHLLMAEVDLLWNGGIGTYVKSIVEKNVDVGDRTNDSVRINGEDLNCRSVAEGGNLGFTQLARVEYAQREGLIYTDFIDNSGGVDCSDHEVNAKILLNNIVTDGDMTLKQRNALLFDMTDEVAELVIMDNAQQTRAISVMASQSAEHMELYRRYINDLARSGKLDRRLEFLPDDKTLMERKTQNKGLTNPEIAILLAYTKMYVKADLLQSDVLNDPYLMQALSLAFPKLLTEKFHAQMEHHSLRREIIATQLSNAVINDMGVLFVYRMQVETGATIPMVIRAYAIAAKVFDMHETIKLIEKIQTKTNLKLRFQIFNEVVRLIRRVARWFLRNNKEQLADISATIKLFKSGLQELESRLPQLIVGCEYEEWEKLITSYKEEGIDEPIAIRLANIRSNYELLDIIAAAQEHDLVLSDVASAYFTLGEYLELAWLREQITRQPVESQWDALARSALRDDLDLQQRNLTIAVLRKSTQGKGVMFQLEEWVQRHADFVARWKKLLTEIRSAPSIEYIMYTVVVRELVEIVRTQKAELKRQKARAK